MTTISLDYETASECPLPDEGLSRYARHPSTRVTLCAYRIDGGSGDLWDVASGQPFPRRVADLLSDPKVEKWAFNAAFERTVTQHVLGIDTPYEGWRCTMALAYTQSYVGGLDDIARQMEMPAELQKDKRGKQLIRMFSMPQRPTKNQPHVWLDHRTNPVEWAEFGRYCVQDVVAEDAVRERLLRYPLAEREWALYELDQRVNDNGLPVDRRFVTNAIGMARKRKAALTAEMQAITGLDNPNSGAQLLPWLKERGYPFDDLQKDTVAKALREIGT